MSTACPPGPLTRRRLFGWGLAAIGGAATLPELLRARPAAAATTAAGTGFVAVVGDSLTVGTQPYQADDLREAGWESATINAYVSRGIATKMDSDPFTGLAAVDAIRANDGEPGLWIVALGTNDAGLVGPSGYPALIARMLDRIGDRPVLWVNIHLPRNASRETAWNAALDAAAGQRRLLRVFDWASVAAAHPSWLTSDGVHYTGTGYQQRANAIAEASTSAAAALAVAQPSARVAAEPVPLVAAGARARLVPLDSPVRVLDTRRTGGLAASEVRTVDVAGVVPPGSTSVVVNVTAAEAGGAGHVTIWDEAQARPATSILNLSPGRTVAAHTICACSSGRLALSASAATHLIVDVQAAFAPTGALGLRSGKPTRLHDSRGDGSTVEPGTVLTLTVPGTDGRAPRAAIVGITLTDVAEPGYVTLWAADGARPATSNLNVTPVDGAVVNTAHVALDATGCFHLATTARAAIIVDLLAIYDDGDDVLWYQAAEPARVLDTRSGVGGWLGAPTADQTIDVQLDAPEAVAVVAGIIALSAVRPGYLVAWSGEGVAPPTSTLNVSTREVRSVCSPITPSTAGVVVIDTVGGGGADVVIDVNGWFTSGR